MTTASGQAAEQTSVTVIGLGEMGAALAGAFLDAGHPTAVWNRTPEKAAPLVAKGAQQAGTVAEAVAAGSLVVVSVKGNDNARELLESAGDALDGRAIVNLTDGTSAEARSVAEWAAGRGVEYLHGQIMTIAPGIGSPDTVVFYGGSESVYEQYLPVLGLLGGKGGLIAPDAGIPTLYGMAVHGTMWGTLNGFLHAAALLSDEGIEVKKFLDQAGPSVSALLGIFPMIADEVDRGEHATPFGALQHHRPSVEDLVRESKARGINDEFPNYTLGLVDQALRDGHAQDSYSRLVEHFRKP
ncbi:NAD(P)-dependent oxidoreductase [Streptomyces microflavus]|jgi:3-hydroxyisobutyrate dehydrogenase-like beta-hydroxyacid dehydrogenase|uniref:NAD(P)-binding domain-containing protein n=2 Tax=Streptomyces microflavus TaxID=1919 RepID=A0A6N9UZA9_STRMI|nr:MULTISPECIES: NAD(P)-binding domain-containing protein [Streptomyces]AGK80182.1 6-phosphogluconate dehydrogenase NAD-binding protein [Streptomyces microflavus DSM 40593]MBK5996131.1 NAD(P)-dependent oxidoreductase [Streptomyces sp. MBT58]MBW3361294.1 NAD(P)-binding domain-containing protein [Streptomyces sp. 09ZI22]MEE1733693.1 NAD(P)-binding domain-containing protein [Streptomyces sp. BE282]NEB65846.1 NAD(P)-dependent oxidoreductase [Streptomyces microflavus]